MNEKIIYITKSIFRLEVEKGYQIAKLLEHLLSASGEMELFVGIILLVIVIAQYVWYIHKLFKYARKSNSLIT